MRWLSLLPLLTLVSCGPTSGKSDIDGSNGGGIVDAEMSFADVPFSFPADAAGPADALSIYPDANVFDDANSACGDKWMCDMPVADGCNPGGGDTCDDGYDDDCDGKVDEGCACQQGAVQPCFAGPPGRRNVGACQDGSQTCVGSGEFTQWGDCVGGITPTAEVCDNLDNECNGCADDSPECCVVDLNCPAPGDMPDGQPFQDYVIDGTMFYSGTVTSWTWTVQGGPCDQLLDATSGNVSYTVAGENTSQLTLTPTLSGDYTITVTMDTPDGIKTCTFIVHIAGPGLRFELCWDTTGSVDLDLHAHKEDDGNNSPWFTSNGSTSTAQVNPEDCYYFNCTAGAHCALPPPFPCTPGGDVVDWGAAYNVSLITECEGSPQGATWQSFGGCHNPRLDIDNISTAGIPENINIDVPLDGQTYRTMVHYYGGSATTHPMVNVYCGGELKATYGAAPDFVPNFTTGGGFADGTIWRVVDVTPQVSGGVTTDCTLAPIHPPGMSTGYYVTTNGDLTY